MQTLRSEPDNSPLTLERSHSAPSPPPQPPFSGLSVHWEALAAAEAGSHGRGGKDSSCATEVLGHRLSKALALSPSPHPLLPTQVTWLGRCPLVLRMLAHSSRAAAVASWKLLVLRSHWASRRDSLCQGCGNCLTQPDLGPCLKRGRYQDKTGELGWARRDGKERLQLYSWTPARRERPSPNCVLRPQPLRSRNFLSFFFFF